MKRVGKGLILSVIVTGLVFSGFALSLSDVRTLVPVAMAAETTEYIIPFYGDLTGPYSELFKQIVPTHKLMFDWWNENIGKKIGVKLTEKVYDTRYDAAETASIHSRVAPTIKPIAIITGGGPMIVPIVEKLAEQKIVAMHWTAGYTFLHRPGGWAFCPLRGYASQWAGFVEWVTANWKEQRKPRIISAVFEGVAGKDIASTVLDPWMQKNPKIEFVFGETMWHDPKPVDLSGHVRKLMKEKPDYILLGPTSISASAFYSAMRELGYLEKTKVMNPCYLGIDTLAKMLGKDTIEGQYEANPIDFTPGIQAHKIYMENIDNYLKGNPWGGVTAQSMFNVVSLSRAIEKAVKNVGPTKLTGQAVYDVLNKGEFKAEEMYGLTGDIKFTPDDRLAGVQTVSIYQMKNGKSEKVGSAKMPFMKMPYMKD